MQSMRLKTPLQCLRQCLVFSVPHANALTSVGIQRYQACIVDGKMLIKPVFRPSLIWFIYLTVMISPEEECYSSSKAHHAMKRLKV